MSKFKITFIQDEKEIARLKQKQGGYPYHCGGIEWVEKTTHECDDLTPFYIDKIYAKNHFWGTDCIEGVDPRLIVEKLNKEKEQAHGLKTNNDVGTDKLHTP